MSGAEPKASATPAAAAEDPDFAVDDALALADGRSGSPIGTQATGADGPSGTAVPGVPREAVTRTGPVPAAAVPGASADPSGASANPSDGTRRRAGDPGLGVTGQERFPDPLALPFPLVTDTGGAHRTGEEPAPRTAPAGPPAPHRPTPWPEARAAAERAGLAAARASAREARTTPLHDALGLLLANPLAALADLPSFDTSAMDGWAVAGPGPWMVRAEGVLAGQAASPALEDGTAVRIATGARVPVDATAVLRSEHGRAEATGRLYATRPVTPGQDIRPRGQECRAGDRLLPAGTLVTPAVLGLAAAAGYDELPTAPRPTVEILILGDELLTEGLPHDGLIRDALGPMLTPWLRALGADVLAVRRLGDDADALYGAMAGSGADVLVTTGGTASGPVDHVHPMLRRIGADLLVDGVAVRPGHPMLLARLAPDRHLVGLPGNPLAAVSGLLTLAEPLLRVLAGRRAGDPDAVAVAGEVSGHPHDTRLVPVTCHGEQAVPLRYNGPAMLRGIAAADALAVVPPGGARPGQELELLDLPWALPAGREQLRPRGGSRPVSSREGASRGPRRDPRDPKDVSRETPRP